MRRGRPSPSRSTFSGPAASPATRPRIQSGNWLTGMSQPVASSSSCWASSPSRGPPASPSRRPASEWVSPVSFQLCRVTGALSSTT
ncbi:hypothetical protein G6F57_015821 [Rhizopus arrhizus]|nr:hypothetical protein G6F24_017249 [Rhizopus arrhizus]KAG1079399.1 hypothetical protein G6F40_016326 [Rhizopus arrhizus]KAG1453016.1 hypothetical protein G6F57_015821 [Rhizopus arrhizus]